MAQRQTYPHLVVRIIPTVYARQQIAFVKDITESPAPGAFALLWPQPHVDKAGQVTPRCRAALVEAVKDVVRETGHRRCVVFGSDDCEFVEVDGSVMLSDEPPSAHIMAADGDVKFEVEYETGRSRQKDGLFSRHKNLGRTACKVCGARIDGEFGGYCGICTDGVLADDSHFNGFSDGDDVECAICLEEIEPGEEAVELKYDSFAHKWCRFGGWCAGCGRATIAGGLEADLCEHCLEDLLVCNVCQEPFPEDEMVVRPDGTTVCGECEQPNV